jgi:CcmD family protein
MNKLKYFAAALTLALFSAGVKAQDTVNANDSIMKTNGKIYVVMTVVIVIVAGLFLYVLNLDRKLTKLEKAD